jgi:hypothetical protein
MLRADPHSPDLSPIEITHDDDIDGFTTAHQNYIKADQISEEANNA